VTFEAPWLRLLRSVTLTELGKLTIALENCAVAFETPLQFPDANAADT
jgi:hypothetical protein